MRARPRERVRAVGRAGQMAMCQRTKGIDGAALAMECDAMGDTMAAAGLNGERTGSMKGTFGRTNMRAKSSVAM